MEECSNEELEWIFDHLRLLGEKAFSNNNHQVVRLVNFYCQQVSDKLNASKPLWREAA